ncbi:kinase-like domain-containing protein [Pilobolus umbonatus]|nr:kinase-like domain-containing protein [Pilobolus umbonatus]
MFPQWMRNVKSIRLERISGAMTNAVFYLIADNEQRLLFRVYGVGVDQIIDRQGELAWLARLSQLNIGASLLGTFGNGRYEEYLPSRTITHAEMCRSDISQRIASCMRELHDIVTVYPPQSKNKPEIWLVIDKWHSVIQSKKSKLLSDYGEKSSILRKFDLDLLSSQLKECKQILSTLNSPLVFAHNDSQYGNILQLENSDQLVAVDFEYSGYNPRGYDIANHFCEWMYNYHTEDSASMKTSQFPTYEQQINFLKSYIHTTPKLNNPDITPKVTPQSLQKEAAMWVMASHLAWGMWGLILANQSEIEFDYFKYSIQRLTAFRQELAKWKS